MRGGRKFQHRWVGGDFKEEILSTREWRIQTMPSQYRVL